MRLTVETGPLAGTQVALDRHHPATLGSGRECTVCIAEPGVASEHAVVKALRDEGFGVKALAPGFGTNGALRSRTARKPRSERVSRATSTIRAGTR